MRKISEESLDRRDREESRLLLEIYGRPRWILSESRCIGGHLTHSGYCCPWCNSDDPGSYCLKENVGNPDE